MASDPEKLSEIFRRVGAHNAAGRYAEALRVLDDAASEHGPHVLFAHYRGQVLFASGQRQEGLALVASALEENPHSALQLCDYGTMLAQTGKLKDAERAFREAVELAPEFAFAVANLGGLLVMRDACEEGIVYLESAAKLDPSGFETQKNLGNAYLRTNRPIDAVNALFSALAINPNSVGAHILLSHALFLRDRFEAAAHHARRALDLEPRAEQAKLHLADALAAQGQLDEAVDTYRGILGRGPNGIPALTKLISMQKTKRETPEFALLVELLDDLESLHKEVRGYVLIAAARAFDSLGEYERAFGYLEHGNDILAEIYPFDVDLERQRAERVVELFSPSFVERAASSTVSEAAPIFICGLPRSGTTLLEQMLSLHSSIQAGGEMLAARSAFRANKRLIAALEERLPEEKLSGNDFADFGAEYMAFARREGIASEWFTDKMPSNYALVGALALSLPRAKFLIMKRDPMNCLFSNYRQNFARNQPATSKLDWLAATYMEFVDTTNAWQRLFPDRVAMVSYEKLVTETESTMRDVLKHLDLGWEPAVLDNTASTHQVGTASFAQVRKPIYTDALAEWRKYERFLAPLAKALNIDESVAQNGG